MRNERTSKRVAKIAGRILAIAARTTSKAYIWHGKCAHPTGLKWSDIQALAASALTQAANKERSK
jgi:hypothetical protein